MPSTDHLQTDQLVRDYAAGEGASSLARRHKVSVWSIITRLREAGVEIRKNQNERRLGLPTTNEYTFGEIVDGILLGDGGLDKKGILHIDQCLRREGWLLDLQAWFRLTGGDAKIIPTEAKVRFIGERLVLGGEGRHLYTPAYTFLQDQRKRWYPDGVKIVPRDIRMTPMVAAQWFCGDGTGAKNGTLRFYTNGFDGTDVDILVTHLRDELGIRAAADGNTRAGEFTIQILARQDAVRFKTLVDPYIPECCRYKLQHVRIGAFSKLYPDQVDDIRRRVKEGEDPKALAAEFKKSIQAIRNVLGRV